MGEVKLCGQLRHPLLRVNFQTLITYQSQSLLHSFKMSTCTLILKTIVIKWERMIKTECHLKYRKVHRSVQLHKSFSLFF